MVIVVERDASSSIAAQAELQRAGTWGDLLRSARRFTGDEAKADDLLHDALERVFDPNGDPWREGEHAFLAHMRVLLRETWARQQKRRSSGEQPSDDLDERQADSGPWPDPEKALARRHQVELARMIVEGLREYAEEAGPFIHQVVELYVEGFKAGEIASRLGVAATRVYQAVLLLKRHAARLKSEWDAAEEARMRAIRDGATPERESSP